ncbi:MAG: hypothetical protein C0490_26635 [Marivirga sp.]|nr:hypothetical protein [Marivirga sp.]
MKKNTFSRPLVKVPSFDKLLPITCFLMAALLLLSSCKDDNDETSPDVAKLAGTYAVAETDMYDEVDNYNITIKKSKDGGTNVEIDNFGDFMYVPVKGTIVGNTLTIPTQTFTANSTIKISGNGTLTGNILHFDYFMESGGDVFEYSCEATKQ